MRHLGHVDQLPHQVGTGRDRRHWIGSWVRVGGIERAKPAPPAAGAVGAASGTVASRSSARLAHASPQPRRPAAAPGRRRPPSPAVDLVLGAHGRHRAGHACAANCRRPERCRRSRWPAARSPIDRARGRHLLFRGLVETCGATLEK